MSAAQFKPGPWYWLEYLDYRSVPHWIVCRQNIDRHDYLLTPSRDRHQFLSELDAEAAVTNANKDAP